MEEQIKIIKEEIPNLKNNNEPVKEPNKEIITNLPVWSIEPPIKINRGQK